MDQTSFEMFLDINLVEYCSDLNILTRLSDDLVYAYFPSYCENEIYNDVVMLNYQSLP